MNYLGQIAISPNTGAESLDLILNLSEQTVKDFHISKSDLTGLEMRQAAAHHPNLFRVRLKELWLERSQERRVTELRSTFKLDLRFQGSLKTRYLPIQYFISKRGKTTPLLNHWERLRRSLEQLQNTRRSGFAEIVEDYPSLEVHQEEQIEERMGEEIGISFRRIVLTIPPLTVLGINKGASFFLALGVLPVIMNEQFQEITSYRKITEGSYYAVITNPTLETLVLETVLDESVLPVDSSLEKGLNYYLQSKESDFLLSLEDCLAEFGDESKDFKVEFYKCINVTQVMKEPISVLWNSEASLHDLKTKLNIEISKALEQYYNIPRGQFLFQTAKKGRQLIIEPSLLLPAYEPAHLHKSLQLEIIEVDEITNSYFPSLDQSVIPLNCRLGEVKIAERATEDERMLNKLRDDSKITIPLVPLNDQPKQDFTSDLPLAVLLNNQVSEEVFISSGSFPNYLAGYLTPSGRLRETCDIILRHLPSVISISIRKMNTNSTFVFKKAQTLFFLLTVELAPDT